MKERKDPKKPTTIWYSDDPKEKVIGFDSDDDGEEEHHVSVLMPEKCKNLRIRVVRVKRLQRENTRLEQQVEVLKKQLEILVSMHDTANKDKETDTVHLP